MHICGMNDDETTLSASQLYSDLILSLILFECPYGPSGHGTSTLDPRDRFYEVILHGISPFCKFKYEVDILRNPN